MTPTSIHRVVIGLSVPILLLALGSLSTATDTAVARTVNGPPYPAALIVKTELRLKANLVRDKLQRPPELVFLGGSRSQRFDPVFARKRTGLSAVNLALSNERPEAA